MDAETFEMTRGECAAYAVLCAFASWALYEDPAPEAVRGLAQMRQMLLEPPFSQVAPAAAAELADLLAACDGDDGGQALLEGLHRDRSYLFYMVGSSKASPYESVWRSDDATMFGPRTLEVRAAYRAAGLEFPLAAKEPDDHVGLEFSFVARLLRRAAGLAPDADALPEGADDLPADASALAPCADFLADHLLVWGPAYLDRLAERAPGPWYRAVAELARQVLDSLAARLAVSAADAL